MIEAARRLLAALAGRRVAALSGVAVVKAARRGGCERCRGVTFAGLLGNGPTRALRKTLEFDRGGRVGRGKAGEDKANMGPVDHRCRHYDP